MLRYLKLYRYFLEQQFKIAVEYRSNFIIGAVGALFVNGASLLTIGVVMGQIPSLNGWTLEEVLLIYGLVLLSRSLSQMFTENLWQVGGYVQEGSFDRFLVRPINPLFQLLAERLDSAGVGNFVIGLVLVLSAGRALDIFSPFNVVYLTAAVLSGGAIFFALNLMTSASAFWIIDSTPVMAAVFENIRFAYYPLSIYPRAINWMLTWVIPYGFASYYPASFVLGRDVGPLAWLGPLVAAVLLVIGLQVWEAGLRHYESTGS
jgi:ABC-2 type transport system permease protein